jgi:hypothetical protein
MTIAQELRDIIDRHGVAAVLGTLAEASDICRDVSEGHEYFRTAARHLKRAASDLEVAGCGRVDIVDGLEVLDDLNAATEQNDRTEAARALFGSLADAVASMVAS